MKPLEYRTPVMITKDAAYILVDGEGEITGIPSMGTFQAGRIVWLPASDHVKTLDHGRVIAWAAGPGTVSISRNALVASR